MQAAPHGRVHLQAQGFIAAQVVEQRTLRCGLNARRVGLRTARLDHVPGQLGNLFEVLGVADHGLAPLGNQRVEQLAHLVVIGRVHRRLVDDESAHIVLDRLGHRRIGLHHALEPVMRRAGAALHDELYQAQLLEGGDLLALFGADIAVYQVAHGGLIGLQVDVVAAAQAHLVAQLAGLVHLVLNLADLLRRVAGLRQLAGNRRVGAHQCGDKLVELEALGLVVFELCGVAGLGCAKIMQKIRRFLRAGNRLTQRLQRLARVFQAFACLV